MVEGVIPRGAHCRTPLTRRRTTSLIVAIVAIVAIVGALSACSSASPSMLDGKSPQADRISDLWWLMFALAVAVYVTVIAFVIVAAMRRRRSPGPDTSSASGVSLRGDLLDDRVDRRFLLYGGLLLPVIVLGIIAVQTVRVSDSLQAATARVHIDVDAKDWWWRISYPNDGVVTANEIHVPVGESVQIALRSDNVVHSLWVPQLNGKSDVIPGETNYMTFIAAQTGIFRGQCAEFCGIEHAKMAFIVIVQTRADFEAWLASSRTPGVAAQTAQQRQGAQLVATTSCAGCHTIIGTAAIGTVGPDLTHVGSRQTLASDSLPNTPDGMVRWLTATQQVKAGALMPQIDLTAAQVAAITAYLESLK